MRMADMWSIPGSKPNSLKITISAFNNIEQDLDECVLWLDENLPKEYTNPVDLARAYDKLSKADVFKRRIRRWQHWRFLVYINALLTAGVAVSKDEKNKDIVAYKPTGRILKLWWAKQKSMKKKAVAFKIAQHTHTSSKRALQDTLPYMQQIFRKNKIISDKIAKQLELDKEEVQWLRK